MSIACVLVPYFAAAVERRDGPSLVEVPLVIGGLPYERGEVYATSREAAKMGVKGGMPLRQACPEPCRRAQALCPEAVFIPPSEGRYSHAFQELLGILEEFTHPVEPDGLGCAYLDLGDQKQDQVIEVVQHIAQAVREEARLRAAIGLAGGRFPAHVAASCLEPNQALVIPPGSERAFLQGFPVELLPADEKLARRLRLLGINTLGQLAALPASAVLAQFGREGRHLQRLAMGHDDRRVIPRHKKEAERGQRVFDHPVDDLTILEAIAEAMVQGLVNRLQTGHRMCRDLRVAIQFEDNTSREEGLIFNQPTFSREKITLNLSQLLRRIDYPCAVVGLEIALGDIVPETGRQLDLPSTGSRHRFVNRVEQEARLRRLLRDLMARYGPDRFYRASLVDREARLPEMRFILPPNPSLLSRTGRR